MANVSSYEETLTWIQRLTNETVSCKYGGNRCSVEAGIKEQEQRTAVVKENEVKIKNLLDQTQDADKKSALDRAFKTLQKVVAKKLHCLMTVRDVTALEENMARLSREFDVACMSLSDSAKRDLQQYSVQNDDRNNSDQSSHEHLRGFISTTAQDCIFGLRDNWQWIAKLGKCAKTHYKNGAAYHQFFHEVAESEAWLKSDLSEAAKRFESRDLKDDEKDMKRIATDLNETYTVLRQWEAKTRRLWEAAVKLTPLPLRTTPTKDSLPARMLCNYETPEINVRCDEEVLLLDNSNPRQWRIRNGKGQVSEVPAVAVLIPGLDQQAIEAAVNMRLRLLAEWTTCLKKIGTHLICFMVFVFKPEYNSDEISSLKSTDEVEKRRMLTVLSDIEDGLKKHWADHEGFVNLQERVLALRMVLEENGEGKPKDDKYVQALIQQINTLGEIIRLYQSMFRDWELFKVALETSRAPEFMLIVDKWQQLEFVTREFFSKFWKTTLPLDESERKILTERHFTIGGVQYEDTIDAGISDSSLQRADQAMEKVASELAAELFRSNVVTIGINNNVVLGVSGTPPGGAGGSRRGGRGSGDDAVFNQETRLDTISEAKVTVGDTREQSRTPRRDAVEFVVRFDGKDGGAGGKRDGVDGGSRGEGSEGGSSGEGMEETVVKTESRTTEGAPGEGSGGGGGKKKRGSGEIRTSQTSESEVHEEGFDEMKEVTVHGRAEGREQEGTDFGLATERKTAETEQLSSAEGEEKRTFVIRAVVNPEDGMEISLQQAIVLGVVRPTDGTYFNSKTGESVPLTVAMAEGAIKVMFTTTKRSQEKTSSIGIITVKTIRETVRPYTIISVRDTSRGDDVSQEEAVKRDIIDEIAGTYLDRRNRKKLLITEAVEAGLMKVEYTGAEGPEPEVISKTYAVRAVVDRRAKKTVTFSEAVRSGIIDRDSGAYKDNVTGEKMYVGDAIMRGFLKARLLKPEDSMAGLDIDPENRMVIDKTEKIRKYLLRPLGVISALKRAVEEGAKS